MKRANTPQFSSADSNGFSYELRTRVNSYFKENNIGKHEGSSVIFKSTIWLLIYFGSYTLILTGILNVWAMWALTLAMGFAMAGIGLNIMHGANHDTFSKNKTINKIAGATLCLFGGNPFFWKLQHNVLHHTYTNIHEHDEDMEAGRILRFSKHAEWQKHHRFQHYYSIFLYGLLTFNWAITTDFQQMYRYMKRKLSYGKLPNPVINWSTLVITKIIYITIWIVLPLIFVEIPWWQVLLGFFIMHYVAGVILSVVFQLAHIVHDAETPLPEKDGSMKNTWAIHQLATTVNFGTKNRIVNWFTGGLNHQVEHHIFPNISHIHYTKISKIVKQTAREFNLPYNEYKTTRKAIISHFKHLKELGKNPALQFQ